MATVNLMNGLAAFMASHDQQFHFPLTELMGGGFTIEVHPEGLIFVGRPDTSWSGVRVYFRTAAPPVVDEAGLPHGAVTGVYLSYDDRTLATFDAHPEQGGLPVSLTEILRDPTVLLAGADYISSNGGALTIHGGAGDDCITDGGDGVLDDTVYGGEGNDTLQGAEVFGGAGDDKLGGWTARYDDAPGAVFVDLLLGDSPQNTGGAGWDSLQVLNVTGSAFSDHLRGAPGDNTLRGLAGDDVLSGDWGDDILDGGDGDDHLSGDDLPADANVIGSHDPVYFEYRDELRGGEGFDVAHYERAVRGVNVSLSVTDWQETVGGGLDLLSSIEGLVGSVHADVLTGSSVANTLQGGAGDDVLNGAAGHDHLTGGLGDDRLMGEGGFDYARYDDAAAGVWVSLTVNGGQDTQGAGTDTLTGIEGLSGSAHSDRLWGNGAANDLFGAAGDDVIWADDGADALTGADGHDVLFGEGGADNLLGGEGRDQLYTGAGDDRADGGGGADLLEGEGGDDVLDGRAGEDQLFGGLGRDVMQGGGGNDYLAGGGDADRVLGGDEADIVLGEAGDDQLSGSFGDDVLDGGLGADVLEGGEGYDTLYGSTGEDTLIGGAGIDSLYGGEGRDVFRFWSNDSTGAETDKVFDFIRNEDVIDLRGVRDGFSNISTRLTWAAAFTGEAGQVTLTFDPATDDSILRVDLDGDREADFVLRINGNPGTDMGFIL